MLYYVFFSDEGAVSTGLAPTWDFLLTGENTTDKSGSAPSVTEIGGGWYKFDIKLGTAPWDVVTEDLLGVIDGGAALGDADRYKPVSITLRGLALAKLAHKGIQTKSTGDIVIYATDASTEEIAVDMTDAASTLTRSLTGP